MKVYVFEIFGKIAHWKKFYTNSSSLTYYFPTRTNILGIIASILELERDSYYSQFSCENLGVGISIKSKLRKKIFVLNYLNTKDFKGHTQIKLELILPKDFKRNSLVKYRIYLIPKTDKIKDDMEKLKKRVKNKILGYGIYLGQRAFKGNIEFIGEFEIEKIKDCMVVGSVVLKNNIKGVLDFSNKLYSEDLIPLDFNNLREIRKSSSVVAELSGKEIALETGKIEKAYTLSELGESFSILE